jgi:hypothetical protein
MPLTWNAEKCVEEARSEEERDYTAYFCFLMIPIGINHLTEKNVDEFYWRLSMYEKLFGNFYQKPLTREFVELRIGYSANASNLTRTQFLKQVEKRWFTNSDF